MLSRYGVTRLATRAKIRQSVKQRESRKSERSLKLQLPASREHLSQESKKALSLENRRAGEGKRVPCPADNAPESRLSPRRILNLTDRRTSKFTALCGRWSRESRKQKRKYRHRGQIAVLSLLQQDSERAGTSSWFSRIYGIFAPLRAGTGIICNIYIAATR